MSDNEQRCAIKFCFRLGHNATETFAKLQKAYADSVLSRAQVFRWLKAFSEGIESIEDEPISGRPSVSKTAENVIRVRDLVHSDRRLTVRMIGEGERSASKWFRKTFLMEPFLGQAVTDQLKAIPISEFHQCYEEWKKRLQRCVASEGSYFEGDNGEFGVKSQDLGVQFTGPKREIRRSPTCLSKNRLWHELCDMLRRLVGTTAPGHHDCSIQE
ncbi:protein GVQW3 [Trichonephila clavipes]|nr:protein GVQW3 [Trichonephila clavipes]